MEVLDPGRVVKVLRRELDAREISGRELDRRLRKLGRETIRKALADGLEGRLWLERLAAVLEAAEIDARVFLALVTGGEVPPKGASGMDPETNSRLSATVALTVRQAPLLRGRHLGAADGPREAVHAGLAVKALTRIGVPGRLDSLI